MSHALARRASEGSPPPTVSDESPRKPISRGGAKTRREEEKSQQPDYWNGCSTLSRGSAWERREPQRAARVFAADCQLTTSAEIVDRGISIPYTQAEECRALSPTFLAR